MPQQAPGLPDPKDYGDLSRLSAGQLVDWIVQRHDARKAKLHYDVRLGTPETGMYSWAARKGMPEPGKKHLAVQQPLHDHDYNQFEGEIPSGYGAGTVKKHDEGKVLITKVEPGKIHLTLAHRRYPERFVLFRPQGGLGGNDKNWLLMNTTPTQPIPYEKVHYKSVPAEKIDSVLQNLGDGSSVQAKIDGAASLTQLLKDKIETLSYRQSKVTNGPILHTERVFGGIPETKVPKEHVGTILRGEIYGERDGKMITPQSLGSILNSSLAKALPAQKEQGTELKTHVFDIYQHGNKLVDHSKVPYADRMKTVRDLLSKLDAPVAGKFTTPEEAHTPGEAALLLDKIRSGQHPMTDEGIVIHPPTGKPMKSKLFDEHDVHIRGIVPGQKKWQDRGAGAFVYSHEPSGDIVGEVGTGFDDNLRIDMFNNPNDYVGRTARIRSSGKLPSGALFQPSLIALHEDLPLANGSL